MQFIVEFFMRTNPSGLNKINKIQKPRLQSVIVSFFKIIADS